MMRHAVAAQIMAACLSAAALPLFQPAQAETPARELSRAELFLQLMELDGSAQNIRNILEGAKAEAAIGIAAELNGSDTLTAEQQAVFDEAAGPAFSFAGDRILSDVAGTQAEALTREDIEALIAANSTPAARRYNELRNNPPAVYDAAVQDLMVNAVVNIVRDFQEGTAPAPAEPGTSLAHQLLEADGTNDVTWALIESSHMPMILQEAGRYIDFSALSETDNARLTTLAETEMLRLSIEIANLNAGIYGEEMSAEDLAALVAAYDIPAQKKLTQVRVQDDGSLDMRAQILIDGAAAKVYERFAP